MQVCWIVMWNVFLIVGQSPKQFLQYYYKQSDEVRNAGVLLLCAFEKDIHIFVNS